MRSADDRTKAIQILAELDQRIAESREWLATAPHGANRTTVLSVLEELKVAVRVTEEFIHQTSRSDARD